MKEGSLKNLEVFLSRNIRKILQIRIEQVIKEKIKINSIQQHYFNIATMWKQIACRQLIFLGKIVRDTDNQLLIKLITAWCNNGRKRSGFLQSDKKWLAQNIRLIILVAAKNRLLKLLAYTTLDKVYWVHIVSLLGNKSISPPIRSLNTRYIIPYLIT